MVPALLVVDNEVHRSCSRRESRRVDVWDDDLVERDMLVAVCGKECSCEHLVPSSSAPQGASWWWHCISA